MKTSFMSVILQGVEYSSKDSETSEKLTSLQVFRIVFAQKHIL